MWKSSSWSSSTLFVVVAFLIFGEIFAAKNCAVNVTSTTSPLSVDTINAILMAHNLARVQVSPPPAEMQLLRWSDALASEAMNYIGSCPGFKHSTTSFRQKKAGFAYIGENLAAGINPLSTNNLGFGTSINMWNAEDEFYGYTTATCPGTQSYCGTCATDQMCGHYTQNVWANTSEIGCAYKECNDATKHYYVCWYGAGGNLWGAAPYVSGASAGADVCTVAEVKEGGILQTSPPESPGSTSPQPAPATTANAGSPPPGVTTAAPGSTTASPVPGSGNPTPSPGPSPNPNPNPSTNPGPNPSPSPSPSPSASPSPGSTTPAPPNGGPAAPEEDSDGGSDTGAIVGGVIGGLVVVGGIAAGVVFKLKSGGSDSAAAAGDGNKQLTVAEKDGDPLASSLLHKPPTDEHEL